MYQMEPRTHDRLWQTFLPAHPKAANDLMQVCMFSRKPNSDMMVYNLYYSTAMARIFYLSINEQIPKTLALQAEFYKAHWNTSLGKATVEEYIANYNLFNGLQKKESKK